MTSNITFTIDAGGVEFTDYASFNAAVEFVHDNNIQVLTGFQGANTYPGESQRYTRTWTITANVTKQIHDFLMTSAKAAFTAATILRVYDKYAAPTYTDYASVKILKYGYSASSAMTRFNITLVVVK